MRRELGVGTGQRAFFSSLRLDGFEASLVLVPPPSAAVLSNAGLGKLDAEVEMYEEPEGGDERDH